MPNYADAYNIGLKRAQDNKKDREEINKVLEDFICQIRKMSPSISMVKSERKSPLPPNNIMSWDYDCELPPYSLFQLTHPPSGYPCTMESEAGIVEQYDNKGGLIDGLKSFLHRSEVGAIFLKTSNGLDVD